MLARLSASHHAALLAVATIDWDTTDVEVYGRCKQGVAYNDQGQRCGRPHVATWAEIGVALGRCRVLRSGVGHRRAPGRGWLGHRGQAHRRAVAHPGRGKETDWVEAIEMPGAQRALPLGEPQQKVTWRNSSEPSRTGRNAGRTHSERTGAPVMVGGM
jgi:hypothetical protein